MLFTWLYTHTRTQTHEKCFYLWIVNVVVNCAAIERKQQQWKALTAKQYRAHRCYSTRNGIESQCWRCQRSTCNCIFYTHTYLEKILQCGRIWTTICTVNDNAWWNKNTHDRSIFFVLVCSFCQRIVSFFSFSNDYQFFRYNCYLQTSITKLLFRWMTLFGNNCLKKFHFILFILSYLLLLVPCVEFRTYSSNLMVNFWKLKKKLEGL